MKTIVITSIMTLFFNVMTARSADNMKAFPSAGEGMVRYVLQLPKQADESAFKVELVVGKMVEVDGVNKYFFAGRIEEEIISGWGFPRYIVSRLGPMGGTLMAVDPDAPKASQFITLGGDQYLIRYNSRLPVVIYVPVGVDVRYRLWRAEARMKEVKKRLRL